MKRILKGIFWILIGLIIALLLVPILFKGQLIDAVKSRINENINAEVDFSDADISLFRDFPSVSVRLDDFVLKGKDAFEGEQLFSSEQMFLSTDFKSIIKPKEGTTISMVLLDKPSVNLIVSEDGKANWDISKNKSGSNTESNLFGDIDYYEIKDGDLAYHDISSDLKFSLDEVNHTGKGSFKNVVFDLVTTTSVGDIDLTYGNIPYLKNAVLDGDMDLAVDLNNNTYTFKKNEIKLNDLDLEFTGSTSILEEGFDFDINFKALNNSVASLVSLIPNAYTKDYKDLKSDGTGTLIGTIDGQYSSAKNILPAIDIKASIDNGSIKYPDLPLPVKGINLLSVIKAKNGNWDDLSVDMPRFSFLIKDDPVSGQMKISNIKADPKIDGRVKGRLNLSNVSEAFPMEGLDLNSGLINGEIDVVAKQSDITNKNYADIKLEGNATAESIDLKYADYLPVTVDKVDATFSPKSIEGKVESSSYGQSDFSGTINVVDPLLELTSDEPSSLEYDIKSSVLNLDELMTSSKTESTEQDSLITSEIPINATGTYSSDKVIYENYDLTNLKAESTFKGDRLDISASSINLDNKPLRLRGNLDNVMAYMSESDTLTGKLFIEGSTINANKYINESENSTEVEQIVEVPAMMDIDIYAEIKNLIYDKYELKNIDGKIDVNNQVAMLTDGQADLFNGKINFEGAYNTEDLTKPLLDFKYNMSDIDFGEMFEKSASFKLLAPLGQYIDGIFNSTLVISGPLKKDMMPDLLKIDASGFMETVNGKIKDFKPLKVLGDQLGIESFKKFDIKDSKNWFEIKEGYVILKDHDYNFDDMILTVGGKHSIDQNIDYLIKAKIPREKLNSAQLGKTLEMGMTKIEQEARSRGVDISLGDFIHLDIFLTGSVLKPKVKIVPVGSGGKTLKEVVKDEFNKQVDILKDTVSQEVKKRTDEIKDSVNTVIQNQVDTVRTKVEEKVEEEKDKVLGKLGDKIKEEVDSTIIGGVLDTLGTKVDDKLGDILGGAGKSEVDSIKSKIKDWNPFKKKKDN